LPETLQVVQDECDVGLTQGHECAECARPRSDCHPLFVTCVEEIVAGSLCHSSYAPAGFNSQTIF
jgi:hypothetical protein